jgi:hypothetical protein
MGHSKDSMQFFQVFVLLANLSGRITSLTDCLIEVRAVPHKHFVQKSLLQVGFIPSFVHQDSCHHVVGAYT